MEQRKILFKAKRLDNGEWCVGDLVHRRGKAYIYRTFEDMSGAILESIDPSTVCQFTGLKDKNGVEIWEHDIIVICSTAYEVVYVNCSFELVINGMLIELQEAYASGFTMTVQGSKFDRKEGEV